VGFLHTEPGWWSWVWGFHFGGSLYDAQTGPAGRATAAAPENVAAYEWVQRTPRRYGTQALIAFQTGLGFYGTAEHPFLMGKVAMTNQGPWLVNNIRAFKPDLDYAAAPFPVAESIYDPDRPVGLLDADVLVIPRGARHPQASFEFVAFTQRPENAEALALAHCKNSPLAALSERFAAAHPNRSIAAHDAIARSPRAFLFPRTRTWPQYEDEFDNGLERIWRLTEPAASVLATIEQRAQGQLDRAEAGRRRRGRAAEKPV
jgi:ABC-type glycerol-3-phosphate transport system substrate-binding protein